RAARVAAEEAKAAELAPASLEAARRLETEGTRLYSASQFGEATAKLFESSGLYRKSEIEARAELQAREEKARAADAKRARSKLRDEADAARQRFERERSRAVEAGAESKAPDKFRAATRLASDAAERASAGDFPAARQQFDAAGAAFEQARAAAV